MAAFTQLIPNWDLPSEAQTWCQFCRQCCWGAEGLINHLADVHGCYHVCQYCGQACGNEYELSLHYSDLHSPSYECSACSRVCNSERAISQHIRDTHERAQAVLPQPDYPIDNPYDGYEDDDSLFWRDAVAIDCEFVGLFAYDGVRKERNGLCSVAVVDCRSQSLFESLCNPSEAVRHYRTFLHGITARDLEYAPPVQQVQDRVADLVQGRCVIGFGLSTDLEALGIDHPQHLVRDLKTLDFFCRHYPSNKFSLKKLAQDFLGRTVQTGKHTAYEDAAITMDLWCYYMENR